MAKLGKLKANDLKKFQNKLKKIQADTLNNFVESCIKELAARLLRKVIQRTPVGQYPAETGKRGGTLRRGWTANKSGSAAGYAASIPITKNGNILNVEIINPVEYAAYVEYGHRTANHTGWVPGRFMLTISEDEIRQAAPVVLENKIKKFLGGLQ